VAPGRQAVNVSVEDLSPDGENAVTLPPGRDLAVTVADSAGRGIRDVMVIAYSDGGGLVEVPREFTDSKGLAVLRGLPAAGSVFVKVSRHMYEGRTVWVAGGDTEARVALSPMSAIEVTLAGERPRAGQNLEFVLRAVDRAPEDEDQRLQRRATVPDESGVVTIVAPPGRVAFWFRCAEGGFKVYDELTVPEGGPARVVYDFPAPGRTVIQVVDSAGEPIEGARIFAADVHMHLGWTLSIGRTPAKKRGQMPTGSVPLAVAATGQPTIVTEPIFLAPGRTVRINLPKGERVGGILVSGEGSPVAGRLRLLTRVDEPEGWAETGTDGRFVLPWPVAPGDHDLEVRAPGFRPVRRTIHVAAGAKNEMEIAVE